VGINCPLLNSNFIIQCTVVEIHIYSKSQPLDCLYCRKMYFIITELMINIMIWNDKYFENISLTITNVIILSQKSNLLIKGERWTHTSINTHDWEQEKPTSAGSLQLWLRGVSFSPLCGSLVFLTRLLHELRMFWRSIGHCNVSLC